MSATLEDEKGMMTNEQIMSTMSITDKDNSPMQPVVSRLDSGPRRSQSPDPLPPKDRIYKIDCRIQQVE